MNIEEANRVVAGYSEQPLEVLGEAIALLKRRYGAYERIAQQVGVGAATIAQYHHISELPDGIRWKVEEGQLRLGLARQVCRLEDENDQWMLAYAIVDAAEDGAVPQEEWKRAVDEVLKSGRSMEEVLQERLGAASEKTVQMVVSFDYWFRFQLCRAAWNRRQSWYDLAYEILTQWLKGREFASTADLGRISQQLTDIANRLEEIRE